MSYYLNSGKFRLTSPYGMRKHPITGQYKMHNGIDLAAPRGTPIIAVADGVVEFVGYQPGGAGYYVKIRHPDGTETVYMHMDGMPPVKVGQAVRYGQAIGYVGSSGAATGPHLHLEFRVGGHSVDPIKYANGQISATRVTPGGGVGIRGIAYQKAPSSVRSYIQEAAYRYGIRPELIAAVMWQESRFNPKARSPVGAVGLMQLMPQYHGNKGNIYDPRTNVMIGTQFLSSLLHKYQDVRYALAAYNAGPGRVDSLIRKYGKNWSAVYPHLPAETRDYVTRILSVV